MNAQSQSGPLGDESSISLHRGLPTRSSASRQRLPELLGESWQSRPQITPHATLEASPRPSVSRRLTSGNRRISAADDEWPGLGGPVCISVIGNGGDDDDPALAASSWASATAELQKPGRSPTNCVGYAQRRGRRSAGREALPASRSGSAAG